MITYLKGILAETAENRIILEVYGIGYEIFCSNRTIEELPKEREIKLYIYEQLKEDSHDLYGFYHKEERELFKKLISVSGIGAKIGLQVLNLYRPNELIEIILSNNVKALHHVNGVGPKTAQRIILELKDSMSKLIQVDETITISQDMSIKHEAIEALEILGYTQQEATKAINAIYVENSDSETLIRNALRLLAV